MTSKGYSNDIKVRCSSWVVAVIMGVCLSDPAKVGLSFFLSRTHTSWPTAQTATHCGRKERLEPLVDSTEGGEKETEMKKKEGKRGERRREIANERDR